LNIKIYSN